MATELIDVSYAQGTIDWKKVKAAGIEAAMLRATVYYPRNGRLGIDTRFKANAQGALTAGIKIGAYHYSYALTAGEARLEARHFLDTIKPYRLEYPAVLDFEDQTQAGLSKTLKSDICVAFLEMVEQAGYYAMLYSMASWLKSELADPRLDRYDKWVAHIGVPKPSYSGNYGIWQYSWAGKVDGIGGPVDMNYAYLDYPAIIKAAGLNHPARENAKPDYQALYEAEKAAHALSRAEYAALAEDIRSLAEKYREEA